MMRRKFYVKLNYRNEKGVDYMKAVLFCGNEFDADRNFANAIEEYQDDKDLTTIELIEFRWDNWRSIKEWKPND